MPRPSKPRVAPQRWWQHPASGTVWALTAHPDHDALLVGSDPPGGSLWVLDGERARPLGDAPARLRDAAWVGASRVLLAVEDRPAGQPSGPLRLVLRDVADGTPDRVLAEFPDAGYRTTLTVDRAGELALVNTSHAMHLVDLRGGAEVWRFGGFQGDRAGVVGGALSPDGTLAIVARASEERVHLFDLGARRRMRVLPGEVSGGIVAAGFSPDGRLAAALTLCDRRLTVWSLPDGDVRFVREGLTDLPPALAFSPDGTRLAVSEHGHKLVVLDTADGSVVAQTKTLDGYALRLCFSRDGRSLFIADDAEVHVVPFAGERPAVPRPPPAAPGAFESLVAGSDFTYHTGGCVDARGDAWIVGQNGAVRSSADGGLTWRRVPLGKRPYLHGACQAADGPLHVYGQGVIATVRDGAVTLDALKGKPHVVAMASSPRATVAASYDKLFRRAPGETAWEKLDPPELRGGWHHGLAVDDEGSLFLASGSYGKGFVARADARGEAWARVLTDAGACWCVACDGARVFVGADGGAVLRSDDRGATWRRLAATGATEPATSLVARGEVVFAAFGDGTVRRSDDGGGRWSLALEADAQMLLWTPGGRVLAVGSGALYGCLDP